VTQQRAIFGRALRFAVSLRHARRFVRAARELADLLRAGGLARVAAAILERTAVGCTDGYDRWAVRFVDRQGAVPSSGPTAVISVLVKGTSNESLNSVLSQTHARTEIIVLGGPAPPRTRAADSLAHALSTAAGEFIVLLDEGDRLHRHALSWVAAAVEGADLIYSDGDVVDSRGIHREPCFKPGWDPEMLAWPGYLDRLVAFRTERARSVGGFGPAGAEIYDLALRCAASGRVRRVPRVLHHAGARRATSVAEERALRDALSHAEPGALVERLEGGLLRVRRPLPDPPPLVSAIVPTRDGGDTLRRALDSLLTRTTYPRLEVIVVDNGSRNRATLELLDELAGSRRVRVLHDSRAFNFSALNNLAVRETHGEVLALVNDDIEALDPGWLAEMVSHAVRPDIGAVGAKLLYPDGRIQHLGIVTGLFGLVGHLHRGLSPNERGWISVTERVRSVSAVTAACLVVRRDLYHRAGGLDEVHLPVAYNDVDFCLRLEQAGYRNVVTPYAMLVHHESKSRGDETSGARSARLRIEADYLARRWGTRLADDPYYNPNLTLVSHVAGLARPPRA
jgi:GT2 family glycosyltransferase